MPPNTQNICSALNYVCTRFLMHFAAMRQWNMTGKRIKNTTI